MRMLNRRAFLEAVSGSMLFTAWSVATQAQARAEWEQMRARTLAGMREVMGELRYQPKLPLDIYHLETNAFPTFTRIRLTYQSEPGDAVPAYLLIPAGLKTKAPAMVCLHQTTRIGKEEPVGMGGLANLHYARELAERGYVCIVPDYPYLGDNRYVPYDHGYVSCTMKGIVNHMRAVDVLRSMRQVEARGIGAIGHSLGGHNTLFLGAFDQRIRAMVTSCGFTSLPKYYNGDLTGWDGHRYMPLIGQKYGKDPRRVPFDFPALLASLAPRSLFINAPLRDSNFEVSGVRDCVEFARPVYQRVFGAGERLQLLTPDAGHDFPMPQRQQAYEFLDRWLR